MSFSIRIQHTSQTSFVQTGYFLPKFFIIQSYPTEQKRLKLEYFEFLRLLWFVARQPKDISLKNCSQSDHF